MYVPSTLRHDQEADLCAERDVNATHEKKFLKPGTFSSFSGYLMLAPHGAASLASRGMVKRNEQSAATLERFMNERKAPKSGQKDMLCQHGATMMPDIPSAIVEGQLDIRLQEHIGKNLRAVYEEIVEEPIPDRFLKLLAELKRKEGERA